MSCARLGALAMGCIMLPIIYGEFNQINSLVPLGRVSWSSFLVARDAAAQTRACVKLIRRNNKSRVCRSLQCDGLTVTFDTEEQ